MTAPRRIQMTRKRPWRADNPDAVIVDRRTKWGNPFRVGEALDSAQSDVMAQALTASRAVAKRGRRRRAALDGHPVCDVHPDDDPVSCGWKRAVADVRRALDA